jgi:uncharacterized protein (UPF0332 family)
MTTPTMAAEEQTEFTNTVLQNAFQLWFEPEIQRRQESGRLPKPFHLWAAQVLLEVGKQPVIFFNDQIRGVLKAGIDPKATAEIKKGESVPLDTVADIQGLQLTDSEANAGHLTAILLKNVWYLLFDFRYNAARVERHLRVAHEFLSTAEDALTKQYLNVAIDNLFAAVELCAKAHLLMLPDESALSSRSHYFVASHFNRHGRKNGNVDSAFVDLFNDLSGRWTEARYPDDSLGTSSMTIAKWIATAKRMLADLDAKRPRLHGE